MITEELNNVLSNKYSYDKTDNENLLRVLFLAEELLKKHDLADTKIEFRNHFEAYGMCYENGEKITLLLHYCLNGEIADVKNTILHEIAHALVGNDCGHNIVWQKKAKELGVTWEINYKK